MALNFSDDFTVTMTLRDWGFIIEGLRVAIINSDQILSDTNLRPVRQKLERVKALDAMLKFMELLPEEVQDDKGNIHR